VGQNVKEQVHTKIQIWMLKNSQVPNRIKILNRNTQDITSKQVIMMETSDVKTMYTNIPHEDLLLHLESLFHHIMNLNIHKDLILGRKGKYYKVLYGIE